MQFVDVGLPTSFVGRDAALLGLVLALGRERRAHRRDRRRRRAAHLDQACGLLIAGGLPRGLDLVPESSERALAHREDRPAHGKSLALALLDELPHALLLRGERRAKSDAEPSEVLARGLLVAPGSGADLAGRHRRLIEWAHGCAPAGVATARAAATFSALMRFHSPSSSSFTSRPNRSLW